MAGKFIVTTEDEYEDIESEKLKNALKDASLDMEESKDIINKTFS